MPKIRYQKIRFDSQDKRDAVERANVLIASYLRQGYTLTLRQLYYQFVAKDLFPASMTWTWTGSKWVRDPLGTKNAEPNYKWLGTVIADARMGGYMDWEAVEDRTREVDAVPHWETAADVLDAAHKAFRVDKWTTQKTRLEVWVEKDAVEGIAKRAAHACDVPVFSCRGYGSLSSLWASANRLREHVENRQRVVLLHLGDHDPSGIDMTRDLDARLNHFVFTDLVRLAASRLSDVERESDALTGLVVDWIADYTGLDEDDVWAKRLIEVRRIALTMDQVRQYDPPPNPAKQTDARFKSYQREYGDESWELDALEPAVLDELITEAIGEYRDEGPYAKRRAIEDDHRAGLLAASANWDRGLSDVVKAFKPQGLIESRPFVPPKGDPREAAAAKKPEKPKKGKGKKR